MNAERAVYLAKCRREAFLRLPAEVRKRLLAIAKAGGKRRTKRIGRKVRSCRGR